MWCVVLIAAVIGLTSALSQVSAPSSAILSEHLASVVEQQGLLHQPEVFHHAIRIINNLESAPSCHRLAAKDLLHTCQSIEVSDDSQPQATLDAIKSIYAARLAICELTGAEAAVPPTCLNLTPQRPQKYGVACVFSKAGCGKKSRDPAASSFSEVSQRELRTCLSALESRPQWWTSYSNARQNAVFMCNAARTEAERDHLLDSYRSMAGSSEALSGALSESARKANIILESQAAFAESVSKLQATVASDIARSRSAFDSFVQLMMRQVDDGLQAAMSIFTSKASSAGEAMNELEHRIADSGESLSSLQSTVNQVFDTMQDRQDELSMQHDKQAQRSTSQAFALRETLSDLRDQQIENVAIAVNGLHTEVQSLVQLMALMHANQVSLNGQIENFDQRLQSITNGTVIIDEGLQKHRDAQRELLSDLQTRLETSSKLVINLNKSVEVISSTLSCIWRMLSFIWRNSWTIAEGIVLSIVALIMIMMLPRRASGPIVLIGASYFGFVILLDRWSHSSDVVLSISLPGAKFQPDFRTTLGTLCIPLAFIVGGYILVRVSNAYRRHRRDLAEGDDMIDIEEVEDKHPRHYDLPYLQHLKTYTHYTNHESRWKRI